MIQTVLLDAFFCLVMCYPYVPGPFDPSAATFSFTAQVASYFSLLLVPVGLAWMVSPRRVRWWQRLAILLAGVIVAVIAITTAINQLSLGVLLGIGGLLLLLTTNRRAQAESETVNTKRSSIPFSLVCVPLILVAFQATALPRIAEWSRDRAILHSAPLIAEIESFRQRRGHYPVSLQSLNRDVPTGVVGIERFHYESNGEAYNLFFVRPHVVIDAKEVVMFNPRDEHRFTSHELDILQYDGEQLDLRRGDRRRTQLAQPNWVSFLFD